MSFFGGGGGGAKNSPVEAAVDPDSAGRNKFAAPGPCPRCELTRNQMQRTVHNYQKAYRKKVEGLKIELGAARGDAALLRERARRMQRRRLLHAPALALGAAVGWLAAQHGRRALELARERWKKLRAGRPSGGEGAGGGADGGGGGGDEAAEDEAAAPAARAA